MLCPKAALAGSIALVVCVRSGSMDHVPVERVIANTEAYLSAHPDDANAHYVLGRVHTFAYTVNWLVEAWGGRNGELHSVGLLQDQLRRFAERPDPSGSTWHLPWDAAREREDESHRLVPRVCRGAEHARAPAVDH